MVKNPAYFLLASLLALIAIIGYRYNQYVVERNYVLSVNTTCNPATEACFQSDCTVAEDPNCDIEPYKKVELTASMAPSCLQEHSCESFSCDGIAGCSVTYCADDTLDEEEACVIPDETATAESEP